MTDIPKARALLSDLALDMIEGGDRRGQEILRIIDSYTIRRPKGRKAPVKSARLTPEIVRRVKRMLRETILSQQQIADLVGVNPGRVSEIHNGLRDDDGRMIR